jgi:hypothetical protein
LNPSLAKAKIHHVCQLVSKAPTFVPGAHHAPTPAKWQRNKAQPIELIGLQRTAPKLLDTHKLSVTDRYRRSIAASTTTKNGGASTMAGEDSEYCCLLSVS